MGSRLMGVVREQVFAFMFGSSLFCGRVHRRVSESRICCAISSRRARSRPPSPRPSPRRGRRRARPRRGILRGGWCCRRSRFVLGLICIIGTLCAPEVVYLVGGGFHDVAGKFDLTVKLTQLLFPFILFVSLAAAVMGMLNARNVFGIPASASTVFQRRFGCQRRAAGVVVRAAAKLGASALRGEGNHRVVLRRADRRTGANSGCNLPSLWKIGFNFAGALNFPDSGLRTVMLLMVPSAIAGSAVQVNVMVNGQFRVAHPGSHVVALLRVPAGAVADRNFFGVAIATVTLPAVARQHALDDLKAFGKTVEEALRFGFYLTLPASIGLAAVAQPVIQLIYEHGIFFRAKHRADGAGVAGLHGGTRGLLGHQDSRAVFLRDANRRALSRPQARTSGVRFATSSGTSCSSRPRA